MAHHTDRAQTVWRVRFANDSVLSACGSLRVQPTRYSRTLLPLKTAISPKGGNAAEVYSGPSIREIIRPDGTSKTMTLLKPKMACSEIPRFVFMSPQMNI